MKKLIPLVLMAFISACTTTQSLPTQTGPTCCSQCECCQSGTCAECCKDKQCSCCENGQCSCCEPKGSNAGMPSAQGKQCLKCPKPGRN